MLWLWDRFALSSRWVRLGVPFWRHNYKRRFGSFTLYRRFLVNVCMHSMLPPHLNDIFFSRHTHSTTLYLPIIHKTLIYSIWITSFYSSANSGLLCTSPKKTFIIDFVTRLAFVFSFYCVRCLVRHRHRHQTPQPPSKWRTPWVSARKQSSALQMR